MKLDYKKIFVRAAILLIFMIVGTYVIFMRFGFEDYTEIESNPGVLWFGVLVGLMAGSMSHVIVERKEETQYDMQSGK